MKNYWILNSYLTWLYWIWLICCYKRVVNDNPSHPDFNSPSVYQRLRGALLSQYTCIIDHILLKWKSLFFLKIGATLETSFQSIKTPTILTRDLSRNRNKIYIGTSQPVHTIVFKRLLLSFSGRIWLNWKNAMGRKVYCSFYCMWEKCLKNWKLYRIFWNSIHYSRPAYIMIWLGN